MNDTGQRQAPTLEPDGDLDREQREKKCPVCGKKDGLWVAKDGHWQVWHPARLFPCGVYSA